MCLEIRRSVLSFLIGFWFLSPFSYAADCFQDRPLASGELTEVLDDTASDAVREWQLPVSSSRPDVMTEARAKVHLFHSAEKGIWRARVTFSFPDPKPFGIPFSFQKVRLSWESGSSELDWSYDCSGPGQSLYPRQSWSVEFDLEGSETSGALLKPTFTLWGSRN